MMRPRQVFDEWMRGCEHAPSRKPWECEQCTIAFVGAMLRSLEEHTGGEAEELRRELENAQTSNQALRVEVHVMQQRFSAQAAAAAAAAASLTHGHQVVKLEHFGEVATLREQLDQAKKARAAMQTTIDALTSTVKGQAAMLAKLTERPPAG